MYNDIRESSSFVEIEPGINLFWEIFSENNTIDFLFKYNFKGWFAIGLSPTMYNCDIHVATITKNGTEV